MHSVHVCVFLHFSKDMRVFCLLAALMLVSTALADERLTKIANALSMLNHNVELLTEQVNDLRKDVDEMKDTVMVLAKDYTTRLPGLVQNTQAAFLAFDDKLKTIANMISVEATPARLLGLEEEKHL